MAASQRWDCGLESGHGLLFLTVSIFKLLDSFHYTRILVKIKKKKKQNKVPADHEKYELEKEPPFCMKSTTFTDDREGRTDSRLYSSCTLTPDAPACYSLSHTCAGPREYHPPCVQDWDKRMKPAAVL